MFLARMVFFRLHESPRYLVHAGRPQDAVKSLQMISKFNGSTVPIELADVRDHHSPISAGECTNIPKAEGNRNRANSTTVFDASIIEDGPTPSPPRPSSAESGPAAKNGLETAYASTGETHGLDSHAFATPLEEQPPRIPSGPHDLTAKEVMDEAANEPLINGDNSAPRIRPPKRPARSSSRRSSMYEERLRVLPRWLRKPLCAWWDRVMMVLAPEWFRTTVFVWSAWCAMSLGKL